MSPAELLKFAAGLAPEALSTLVAWLAGECDSPPAELEQLPETLRSSLALEAMKARAKVG